MLFLIATPIGNLSDITLRALEALKKVDYILCEDTRTSSILLQAHGISTPLKSFHKFSEKKEEDRIIEDLRNGKSIALISDAGTPGISDPGQKLVQRCRQENLRVTSLPGPCSPILALTLAGFSTDRFQFLGFLPKKASEKKELLISSLFYPGVSIFFESPKRLKATLEEMDQLAPSHSIAIAREMTKIYEECLVGVAADFLDKEFRGEVVLLIEGNKQLEYSLTPKDHVESLQNEFSLSKQDAIKLVAKLRGISRSEVYSCIISGENL